jgi:hypothetical protein
MSIEAAFPLTPTISIISYGKLMFELRVLYLRAHFQERNYRVEREVAVSKREVTETGENCTTRSFVICTFHQMLLGWSNKERDWWDM